MDVSGLPWYVAVAAFTVVAGLVVTGWAITGARSPRRQIARNLAGVTGPTDLRQVILSRPASERAIQPVLKRLTGAVRGITPKGWTERLQRQLDLAGRPPAWPLERVLAIKALLALVIGGGALVVWLMQPSLPRVLFGLGVAILAFFSPDLILYSRGQERQKTIQLELPDALDQMTICVEAGLGFESAMARTGQTGTGPLADEFIRTLQDMQVGVRRRDALANLTERTDVRDLRTFVTAIQQADAHGIPIGDVLRTQADEMRTIRRQRAEEQAMKIPVKVVFPLILCILPTLFIVIMGPAVLRIVRALGGGF